MFGLDVVNGSKEKHPLYLFALHADTISEFFLLNGQQGLADSGIWVVNLIVLQTSLFLTVIQHVFPTYLVILPSTVACASVH